MAIKSLRVPVAVSAGTTFEVVLLEDAAVWRENGGGQIKTLDDAREALAQAEAAGEPSETVRAELQVAVAEAEAAVAAALARVAAYARTSDVAALVVPDDATVWALRALDPDDVRDASEAAGLQPLYGAVVAGEVERAAEEALTAAGRGKRWTPQQRQREARLCHAREMDRLPREQRAACEEHVRWQARLRVELIRRALVSWRNGPEYDTPAAFVADLQRIAEQRPHDALLVELGRHVENICAGLHPRGKASSASPSGGTTGTPASGAASSAAPAPDCASSEAGAAAC